jgi:hypothetical protein
MAMDANLHSLSIGEISLKSDFGGFQWPEVRGKNIKITRFVYILGFHFV